MASMDKPILEPGKVSPPVDATPPEAPPLEYFSKAAPPRPKTHNYYAAAELVLRLLLYVFTLAALVVMVTGKQTVIIQIPFPPFRTPLSAKFTDSPSFIYLLAALSVACLYSIITSLLSISALFNQGSSRKLLSHFILIIIDVVMLAVVSSASGAAIAIGYVGWKGNSNVGWNKICNIYDTFCLHAGFSVMLSLIASTSLISLISLSVFTLSRKIPK